MSTPNHEPRNPYSSDYQGQNQQFQPNDQQPQYPYQGQYPQYQQNQYQQPYPPQAGYPTGDHLSGSQAAQTSLILGILSLFFLGLILGPIAIYKANQAERKFNTPATAGKITGWIGTILAICEVASFIFVFLMIGTTAPFTQYSQGF